MASDSVETAFLKIVNGQLAELSMRERIKRALKDPEAIEVFGSGKPVEVQTRQEFQELLGSFSTRLALWPDEMNEVATRLAYRESIRHG